MLMINKDDFNEILMQLMQDDLDIKIKLMTSMTIFQAYFFLKILLLLFQ